MNVETAPLQTSDEQPSVISPDERVDIEHLSTPEVERGRWEVPEENVRQKLLEHVGPVFVDLDETLYLRNSTEAFISVAAPSVLAAFMLRLLDMARPWRIYGGQECRDNWRILMILMLFPWTYARWLRYCRDKVSMAINVTLRDALLQQSNTVVIASNGYNLLIRPMFSYLGLPNAALVCCQLLNFRHRREGKLALVQKHYDSVFIAKSLTITDSFTDAKLMRASKSACLTVWNEARFERAFEGKIYLPGDYLSRVKRPRQGALRSLVIYDLLPWLFIGLSVTPTIQQFVGLVALFFSMWSVYEIGYYDNDQCARKYEVDPKLTSEALAFNVHRFEFKAWTMAACLGGIGVAFIYPDNFVLMLAAWVSVLLALYGTYWLYNRVDKTSRIWLYALLQVFRFGSILVMVMAGPVAIAAATAQIFARWIDYIIYRYQRSMGVTSWPKTANQAVRMTILLILVAPLVLQQDWMAFGTTASLCFLLFAYGLWKYEWNAHANSFHRLDRPNIKEIFTKSANPE